MDKLAKASGAFNFIIFFCIFVTICLSVTGCAPRNHEDPVARIIAEHNAQELRSNYFKQ